MKDTTFSAGLISLLLVLGSPVLNAQTGSLTRRFNENSFRRSLQLDLNAPMFTENKSAEKYFDYQGEWKMEINSSARFDSNAFQDTSGLEDWRWNYGAMIAYEWWTSKKTGIVIKPSLGMSGQRFDRYGEELDGDLLNAGLEFTFKNLPFAPTFHYDAGRGFTPGYDSNNYNEQLLGLKIGQEHKIGKAEVEWLVGAGHLFTDPDDLSATQATIGLKGKLALSESVSLLLDAGTGYRDFTEDSAMERDTWIFNAGAALEWTFFKNESSSERACSLIIGTNYTQAADQLPEFDYEQVTAYISLNFAWDGFRFLSLPRGGQ